MQVTRVIPLYRKPKSIRMSPSGRLALVAFEHGMTLYDLTTGIVVKEYNVANIDHESFKDVAVAWKNDKPEWIVVGTSGPKTLIGIMVGGHAADRDEDKLHFAVYGDVTCATIKYDRDRAVLYAGTVDGRIMKTVLSDDRSVFSAPPFVCLSPYHAGLDSRVTCIAMDTTADRWVVSGNETGTVVVWDSAQPKIFFEATASAPIVKVAMHSPYVLALAATGEVLKWKIACEPDRPWVMESVGSIRPARPGQTFLSTDCEYVVHCDSNGESYVKTRMDNGVMTVFKPGIAVVPGLPIAVTGERIIYVDAENVLRTTTHYVGYARCI